MGSTYYRNLKCYHKNYSSGTEEKFIITAETAENNVFDSNGRIIWKSNLLFTGNYFQVLKGACQESYLFEEGMMQFKPINKTPEGFIHSIRKLMKDKNGKPEDTRCDSITIKITWDAQDAWNDVINTLIKAKSFENKYHLFVFHDGALELKSDDVDCIIRMKQFIKELYRGKERNLNKTWMEIAKDISPYYYDKEIANLFKKESAI